MTSFATENKSLTPYYFITTTLKKIEKIIVTIKKNSKFAN